MSFIYLDHAAAGPLHPDVLEAMLPYLQGYYGNPSSLHRLGREAKQALLTARDDIAYQLGCRSNQLIFTSGGTESDNLAILGTASVVKAQKRHVITTQIEHHAVLHACRHLEKLGFDVTYIPVDPSGSVKVSDIEQAIRPDTFLISCMYVNNEVGTIQPIQEIGELARAHDIYCHVDAVQALGSLPIDLAALQVDLMSFSAHKINGPKGIGALYAGPRIKLDPMLHGGSQERKKRAGTENVAGAVGFAKAVALAAQQKEARKVHATECRNVFLAVLEQHMGSGSYVINGGSAPHLPNILNLSFPGLQTETLLMNLDLEGIAAASGSACTSGSLQLSHVLMAMGLSEAVMQSAVRFSFGFSTTIEDVKKAAQKTATIVQRLRKE